MTKKHFISLANTLKTLKQLNGPSMDTVVSFLAEWCREQNPRFNAERWLRYIAGECGPNGGKVGK